MNAETETAVIEWLSSPENPATRYLVARDLVDPRPSSRVLTDLRHEMLTWGPLNQIVELQLDDGSFPQGQKTPTTQPTFWALCLMARCGLDVSDEPVRRAVGALERRNLGRGALSFTSGASGMLPCYAGVVSTALIEMGMLETDLVQSSIDWLVAHQRFDHKELRAGGDETWPYRAPVNYRCWETVSCYHGVVGAFRALAAIPDGQRSPAVRRRLEEALSYLRLHRLYKKSSSEQPLFRHMTQFFLVGDYRSDLIGVLQGVADADPGLIHEPWVAEAVIDIEAMLHDGRVTLVKNYGRKLIDPIPFEPVGEPSRFLTYQWLSIRRAFDYASAPSNEP